MTDTPFIARNGLVANGTAIANSTQISLGDNVVINTSALFIGNSTANAYVTTGGLFVNGSLFVGVNTSTAYIFSNTITFTSNISIGNSTVNAVFTPTSLIFSSNTITINGNGNIGIGTSAPRTSLEVVGSVSMAKANVLSQTLTAGNTTVATNWDASNGQIATVTLTSNTTMAAPTNLKVGTYILYVKQDATGSRFLAWNSVYKWPAAVAPTLTTTASRTDLMSFVSDGTNLYGTYINDVR